MTGPSFPGSNTTAPDSSGNDAVRVVVSDRPTAAEDKYLEWSGAAGSNDNDVIYTSPDVSGYNYHTVTVSGTDSADVYVSVDGVTYDLMSVSLTDDAYDGETTAEAVQHNAARVVTIPTGKTGYFEGKYKRVRVIQDGATDSDAIGAHGNI